MNTYTLVAYKPNGSSRNCGRGCCGSTTSDSDFLLRRGLTLEELAVEIAKLRISYVEGHREEYQGEPFEVHYFDDTGTWDWESNEDRADYYEEATGFNAIDKQLEALISQQQPIIKQKQEQEAKEAAAKAAEAERIRRTKWEAEEKERRDREEYARLKTKFAVPHQ